jgi:lambda family phage portal protein
VTWLDRAISWVSPKAGLTRVRARAALELMRAYEGASLGRRTSGWRTTGASANTEIAGSLPRLRARSRDLVRNNPYARRAITTLVGNAVGTGIMLGIKNAQAAKVWSQWLCEADFHGDHNLYGLQALGCRAAFESGDCLIVRVRTTMANAGRSGVPLRLKVLEGDFLDTTKTGPQENGNYVIAGVEVDSQGRRVAYYLYTVHPGDTVNFQLKVPSTRVLAEDVIYHYEKERPGQILGVPRLAASIMRLRDVDEYQEALLVKKKIEACFAAFVSSTGDDRPLSPSVETETTSDGTARRVEKLSPGTIIYGKEGEEVTFGNPSSGPEVGFIADELRAIAMGAGCTYEQLTGDLSNTNYSSMRGGRSEFKILVEQYRWLSFMPQVCERIYGWFEEAAFLAGKIRTTEHEHMWTPPRWEYVNPKEDVEVDLLELRAKLASHSAKLRERGEDRDQVLKEIAEDVAAFAKLGSEPDYGSKIAVAAEAPAPATNDSGAEDRDLDLAILEQLRSL